tara:strand:- start:1354 stop:1746 length:393 start_codon:yes stop_codon:yes gene_type:complete
MTKDEALRQALDLILCWERGCESADYYREISEAQDAIKEALAQPEHHPQHSHTLQERYAELHLYGEISEHYAKCNPGAANLRDWVAERIDKAQRQWVGLTRREFEEATSGLEDLEDCWMAIEAKLKERNA